ncbi:unnamed protein product [Pieris macdunnoughi]|uniref:Uncharacterized protein n=1 Tax=Pieris macdunnoughi TaxID=345717 RepID=A0A821SZB4_9NEOP|nr:unnamed protein product [Pieris macdunnoughi]
MMLQISSSPKRFLSIWRSPAQKKTHKHVIKLATVRLTPNLKLLSFRVSRNFLYFSFAKPDTDLHEYIELCEDDLIQD